MTLRSTQSVALTIWNDATTTNRLPYHHALTRELLSNGGASTRHQPIFQKTYKPIKLSVRQISVILVRLEEREVVTFMNLVTRPWISTRTVPRHEICQANTPIRSAHNCSSSISSVQVFSFRTPRRKLIGPKYIYYT